MLAVWQATIVDSHGDVVSNASVQVLIESSGALAALFADRDGETPISNPITADENGFVRFYAAGNSYRITATSGSFSRTWRHVPIGLLSELDVVPGTMIQYEQTDDEIAAGVTPASLAGSSRPWTDAVLRYGLIGDGATDNLTAFTEMFSVAGQALFIKRGDYVISAPVSIPSNTTLYLEPGTIIRDGGVLANTSFIRIETVSNVHIIGWGAKVLMDRADYTEDEQRHGVMIRGDCENICIEGLESSNCGGDGFFIGQHAAQSVFPQHVRLVGCKADNNRRQGLSITSGRHIRIVDCVFSNTNGTAPQAGIDIEPDASHFVLQDIRLENVTTIGNAQQGIKIYLAPLDNTSDPVDIEITNHRDVGSAYGLTVHQAWQGCRGNIRIHNPVWERNTSFGFAAVSCAPENILIEIFDPLVLDCNQGGSLSDLSGTAYAVYREAGVPQTGKIGGVHIYNPDVQVTLSNYPVTSFYVANSDEPGEVDDVWIIDPKNVEYTAVAPTLFGGSPVYITDRHRVMRGNFTGALTVTASRYFSHYSNDGATGQVDWDLADWPETESERTFEVHEAQIVNVRANIDNAALRIFPGSYTALRSNEVGAKITLKRGPGGFWVTNMVGVWHNNTLFNISNETTDRSYDADMVAVAELADVVATLIQDLRRGT